MSHNSAGPRRGGGTSAVEVTDLVKRYRTASRNAVDGISFEVPEGQLFCLLGPNGAGKTTTVSVLTTTLAPTSGTVRIAGWDVRREQAEVRRRLGVVFQQPSLDLNLTVEENIRLHAVLYGMFPWRPTFRLMTPGYRSAVEEAAGVLGLADLLGRPTRALSGGLRRRLEIVRALMHAPAVLFLDEPSAGLDPESRRSLWEHLRQVRSHYGTTVFLTTHYLEEAETADTVCVIYQGRIIEHGSPAEVKGRQLAAQLVLDARDRGELRRELRALGIQTGGDGQPDGAGPLRVHLDGRSAQSVVAALSTELTTFRISEPTLEEAYLQLLTRAGS